MYHTLLLLGVWSLADVAGEGSLTSINLDQNLPSSSFTGGNSRDNKANNSNSNGNSLTSGGLKRPAFGRRNTEVCCCMCIYSSPYIANV